jgi:hypothetical protein
MIENKDLYEAVDRIACTADGRILYLFLQKKMMELPDPSIAGALRCHHGERTFAAKLIGLMAKGIAESGGRDTTSTDDTGRSEPVIVFAAHKPVDAGPRRPRGNERRVRPDTIVAGWNDGPDDPAGQT